jgi:hypothetical protein
MLIAGARTTMVRSPSLGLTSGLHAAARYGLFSQTPLLVPAFSQATIMVRRAKQRWGLA